MRPSNAFLTPPPTTLLPSGHDRNLLGPVADFLMVGGLSLMLLPLCFLFVPPDGNTHNISIMAFYLAFVVNYPHFLISYQFLYVDNFHQMAKNWRMFLAGIAAPAGLIACLGFAFFQSSPAGLGYMANAMYFLVGHHYVKQILGCMVAIAALKKVSFGQWERRILAINMFAMWMVSFLNGNVGVHTYDFHGIKYSTWGLPPWTVSVCYVVIALSLVAFIWQTVDKYIQTGKWIPLNALVAFASIYAWHIPLFYHPGYFVIIPFFHSLQYLLFAFAYVKNRCRPHSPQGDSADHRKKYVWGTGLYVAASVALGFLGFQWIPEFLDGAISYDSAVYGPTFFMFAFVIFINIHHYFIDFAIWRRDNPNIRKYLFEQA